MYYVHCACIMPNTPKYRINRNKKHNVAAIIMISDS